MNKEEFIKKLKSMQDKAEQYKKLDYLKVTTDEEYKQLKKEIKEQILINEIIGDEIE